MELEQRILDRMPDIERWLRTQWQEHAVPFYASVDLRNAGFKLAPVDTNLFPGGFNNLNPAFLPLCVQAIQAAVERVCPDARGVLLVPENHTRNTFYLQNVETLQNILRQAGMRVRIGSLIPELDRGDGDRSADWGSLTLEPIVRNGRRVGLARLRSVHGAAQQRPVGRARRRSSRTSTSRSRRRSPPAGTTARSRITSPSSSGVAKEFAAMLGIDPWLIDPYFGVCGEIDFQERAGEECLASNVSFLLDKITRQVRGIRHRREAVRRSSRPTPAPTAWAS